MGSLRATLFALLLASFVVVQGLAAAGVGPPPALSILSTYALFGFSSLGVQHVLGSPDRRMRVVEAGLIATLAVVAGALVMTDAMALRTAARAGLIAAGSTGLAGYLRDVGVATGRERHARLLELRDASIVPLAVMQVPFFLWATTGINPVYDARVLAFERGLGLELSALAHHAFRALPVVPVLALACYYALPVGLALVVMLQPTAPRRTRVLAAAIGAGVMGFAAYAVCPVVGIFPAFGPEPPPAAAVDAAPMIVPAHVPRNGMPSLHTAWALLIALNAWPLAARWRAALCVFAALNVWAAAGAVGHWAMDIVVAVPLAAAVQLASHGPAAGRASTPTPWPALACAAIAAAWIAGFRLGVPLADAPPPVAWLAVALTVAVPAWCLARARSASQRVRP